MDPRLDKLLTSFYEEYRHALAELARVHGGSGDPRGAGRGAGGGELEDSRIRAYYQRLIPGCGG